jgi:class 3 adenylate cyclase
MAAMARDIRYCTTSDGVSIAYVISGQGDRWLFHTLNPISAAIQLYGAVPGRREWIDALGEHFTVVEYDARGAGFSDRDCDDLSAPTVVADLSAVIDATGVEQFDLFGYLSGSFAAMSYAVEHPERVAHLMLWPPPILDLASRSNRGLGQMAIADWENFTEAFAHLAFGWTQGEQAHAFAAIMRETVSRETWLRGMTEMARWSWEEEWASVARLVTSPTLVFQRKSYPSFPVIAGPIRGASVRMVEGASHGPYVDAPQAALDVIFEFTGVERVAPASAPVAEAAADTAVILFTDIADSTALTERLGDGAFRSSSRALEDGIRKAMRDAGGTPVEGKVLGDGVMAVFTSASQAVAAARRCLELSAASELQLHIGLHAGDVIREGSNVYGGAVNIASRICGLCEPGEILVSQTVRDLARTSAGVTFEDRGEHALKGIGDPMRVFAVRLGP